MDSTQIIMYMSVSGVVLLAVITYYLSKVVKILKDNTKY